MYMYVHVYNNLPHGTSHAVNLLIFNVHVSNTMHCPLGKYTIIFIIYVTQKARTDLMALTIFDWWPVFNSLLRSHLSPDDDETWFPGCCIIHVVHQKYKIINLCSKLSSCTSGLNRDSRSKISSAIRSVFAFRVTYYTMYLLSQCTCICTCNIITGATATVSTLATVVGHPNTPTSAGKGGLRRGFPCFPSKLSMSAYSQQNKDSKTMNYPTPSIIGLSPSPPHRCTPPPLCACKYQNHILTHRHSSLSGQLHKPLW